MEVETILKDDETLTSFLLRDVPLTESVVEQLLKARIRPEQVETPERALGVLRRKRTGINAFVACCQEAKGGRCTRKDTGKNIIAQSFGGRRGNSNQIIWNFLLWSNETKIGHFVHQKQQLTPSPLWRTVVAAS